MHHPTDECAGQHCYSHMEDEPQEPCYRMCGECFHVFPDGQALLDADTEIRATFEDSPVAETDPAKVFICPFCAHDF